MQFKGLLIFQLVKLFLRIKGQDNAEELPFVNNADPSSHLITHYGEFYDETTIILKSVLNVGHTYFEVDPQSGYHFYKMAGHLGATGLAFGLVKNQVQFEKISSLPRKSYFEALLGTGHIGFIGNTSEATVDSILVMLFLRFVSIVL